MDSMRFGLHYAPVRTTLTLDPDVAERLRQEMRRMGKGLKAAVDDALRLGLGMTGKSIEPGAFEVKAHAFGFRPGIDLDRLDQLADGLEVEERARKLVR